LVGRSAGTLIDMTINHKDDDVDAAAAAAAPVH